MKINTWTNKAMVFVIAMLIMSSVVGATDFAETIDTRQQHFLSIADNFESLKNAEDGNDSDWNTIKTLALKNSVIAGELMLLFPAGSSDGIAKGSRSKSVVWTKWDKFEQTLTSLQTSFNSIAHAATVKDSDALDDAIKMANRSCKSCHRSFRTKR